ncbi:multiheme c-type cytochrome [Bacteroidota bacterium]
MSAKNLFLILFLTAFVCSNSIAQTYTYIGAAKCKMCHNKTTTGQQYKKWSEGPHANAMSSLKEAEKKNPKCLKCHSTAASVDKSLVGTMTVEEGVTCEACHGPGSAYKSASVMRDRKAAVAKGMIIPDEKLCKKCHNSESPTFKGFDYAKYLAKIAHLNPANQ